MTGVAEVLPDGFLCAEPAATAFFSGAGISADAPTSAPIGNELVDRALAHAFEPGTAETLNGYYSKLELGRCRPRLETVLEIARRVHGDAVLEDLLSDLHAPPNDLHALFAWHAGGGGRHITANFDTCIERAADTFTPDVFHFHGSLGSGELGVTLGRIERGLPADIRAALDERLLADGVDLVVFVGYSGSDFFDVDPYLRGIEAGTLAGRRVLWLTHTATVSPARAGRPQLEWLARAGAKTAELNAPTREALNAFAGRWGRPLLGTPGPRAPHWAASVSVAEDARRQATLELYTLMGLHRETARRLSVDTDDQEPLAHTRWAQGRYREAGVAWQRSRAHASAAARAEREGAVLWIRGQYREARDVLVTAIEQHAEDLDEQLLLAETLARVYQHAKRFVDSRCLATPALREFLRARLPDPDELAARGQPLGVHLRARVFSVRWVLGLEVQEDADPVESFNQFEALNAQLNYRQGQLRERADLGLADAEDFRRQRRDFATIGATGDAARAVLLGGPGVFSLREILDAAASLDVTDRHRLRLVAASAVGAARRWLRRKRP